MSEKDTVGQLAIDVAVITERLAHHGDDVDTLQQDVKLLQKCLRDLKTTVEKLRKNNASEPTLLKGADRNLKDYTQWSIIVLVIFYSFGAETPHDVLVALLKVLTGNG